MPDINMLIAAVGTVSPPLKLNLLGPSIEAARKALAVVCGGSTEDTVKKAIAALRLRVPAVPLIDPINVPMTYRYCLHNPKNGSEPCL